MHLLQGVEEGLKGGATKVGDGAQAREETPVQHLLEVPLTDVLGAQGQVKTRTIRVSAWPKPTQSLGWEGSWRLSIRATCSVPPANRAWLSTTFPGHPPYPAKPLNHGATLPGRP